MTDHQVRIALPVNAVRQAWRRYVGYGGTDNEGEEFTWHADDGSGLTATFLADGDEATVLTTHRSHGPDALPDAAHEGLVAFVDGFVDYVNAAHDEVRREPGATTGSGLAGPDGTSHTGSDSGGLR